MSDTIRLSASGLASKWGFFDGDLLYEHEIYDDDGTWNEHDVIEILVRRHLVPVVEAVGIALDLFRISTIHNPIRTMSINGQAVIHTSAHTPKELDGIHVDVSMEDVQAAIEEAKLARAKEQDDA